jgi:hypothetical protein
MRKNQRKYAMVYNIKLTVFFILFPFVGLSAQGFLSKEYIEPAQDSNYVLISSDGGVLIYKHKDSIDIRSDLAGAGGSSTTNALPLWVSSTELTDSWLSQASNTLSLAAANAFRLVGGSTASRPIGQAGSLYYNTDKTRHEYHNGTEWYDISPWSNITDGIESDYIRSDNNGIVHFPYATYDSDLAYGIGYFLGKNNTGDNFSGGAGYQLGENNTGANFSGGAGVALGRFNTGNNFSGGAGALLGRNNTGNNFSGGAGYWLGRFNTGANFSGGAGYQLGERNTGNDFSGGAGAFLGRNNTGDNFSIGAGAYAAQFNTGNDVSGGAGIYMGEYNTGDFVTLHGAYSGRRNAGSWLTSTGYLSAIFNTGDKNTFYGAYSGQGSTRDSITAVGYKANGFVADNTKLDTLAYPNQSGDTLFMSGSTSKWGTIGDVIPLEATVISGSYSPTGISFYEIVSDTSIRWTLGTPVHGSGETQFAAKLSYPNTTSVGAFSSPDKPNQVVLGNTQIAEVKLGNVRVGTDNASNAKEGWIYAYDEAQEALVLTPVDTVSTAELYTTTGTVLTSTFTWTHVSGLISSNLENFTTTDSTLTYTDAETTKFIVHYSGTIQVSASSAGSNTFDVMLYKNNTQYLNTRARYQIQASGTETWESAISGHAIIELSQNDVISLRYTSTTGATYNLRYANISAIEL